VVNTSDKDWKEQLGVIAKEAKPSSCLECVADEMTGLMMQFLGFKGTVILYGLLSDKPAGGIDVMNFIGKNLTLEAFLLTYYVMKFDEQGYKDLLARANLLFKDTTLKTVVQKRFGLHQIKEAIEFY